MSANEPQMRWSRWTNANLLRVIREVDDGADPSPAMLDAEGEAIGCMTATQYGWWLACLYRRAFRFAVEFRNQWEANPDRDAEIPPNLPVFMFAPPVPDDVSALEGR